jgi:hypothetical protein
MNPVTCPFLRLVAIAMFVSVLSARAQSTELPLASTQLIADRCADLAEQRDLGTLPLRREATVALSAPTVFETVATAPLRPRVRARKPAPISFDPRAHTGRIVLKLADDEGFSVGNDGVLMAANPGHSRDVGAVVSQVLGTTDFKRIFTRPERHLAFDRFCGERWAGEEMPDLTQFLIIAPQAMKDVAEVETLVRDLNAMPFVEVAYFEGRSPLPAAPTPRPRAKTETHENLQGYLNAAPQGVDARYAWQQSGGTGANSKLIDVEIGWNLAHEDVPTMFTVIGTMAPAPIWQSHGTSVLGILAARQNSLGVVGIARDASVGVSATDDSDATIANAVNLAAVAMNPGDVILVERHVGGPQGLVPTSPCGQVGLNGASVVPAEFDIAAYAAITAATGNQRIVVEAAGNGAANLADPRLGGMFDPLHPYFQQSNAIIVGARQSASGIPRCETNFGLRLDTSAWGENVATAGGPFPWNNLTPNEPADSNRNYTSEFGGTSSAAAIIAGAVAAIQSIQLSRGGRPFPPNAMRRLVAMFGTPQAVDSRLVGKMPDLRAIHLWMIADSDGDGMANADELAIGRNPDLSEPAVLMAILGALEE